MHSTVREYALRLNKPQPIVDYLIPLIGFKKEVSILDVGSGPYPITGQYLTGVSVKTTHCDKQDFAKFWEELGEEPMVQIEKQDMENLTYPDNSFDIVHCVNALDHTKDALAALEEMLRVCKSNGWVYIDCCLDQLTAQGKKHYWDAKEDGTLVNKIGKIDLKGLGFDIEYVDNGGERQYNHVIAKARKA